MRSVTLAVLLCSAVPAVAQSATAPGDTTSIFHRTYSERSFGLGVSSSTGPFGIARVATGFEVGHGVGVGVQAVVGEVPGDGLSTFVGLGPAAQYTRALPGGAALELRAGALARFGNVQAAGVTGDFGLRSVATSASATVSRPISITGGLQIVPRAGVRALADRRFGEPGVGAFQSGAVTGVDALVGADVRFRAFKRWWTIPLVVPVRLAGQRTFGYGF